MGPLGSTPLLPGTSMLPWLDLCAHLQPGLPRLLYRNLILDGADIPRIMVEDHRFEHTAHDLATPRLGQHANNMHLADDRQWTQFAAHGVEQGLREGI